MTALEILRAGGDFSQNPPLPPPQPRVSEAEYSAAMASAHQAAAVLKEHGATKVVLFGSLARKLDFERRSDIDLAAWGIPSKLFFVAGYHILDIDPTHETNLIDGATVSEGLRKTIELEGLPL